MQNIYEAGDRATEVRSAVGTPPEAAEQIGTVGPDPDGSGGMLPPPRAAGDDRGHDGPCLVHRNGLFLGRFVHGPGESEPLYQLDDQGRRNWYHADERGSIVAVSDSTGAVSSVIPYDEYGNTSALPWSFGYAGAFWMPLARQYYMRARVYDPALGRFLQADPIGYGDGMNLYAYVGGDPVNLTDPSGMFYVCTGSIIPQASPCVSEDVNFLSVHWLSLPPGPRSAPDGTDAEGSGTGPAAPNTASGTPGSPGLGTLPGGGHESAHLDDDTIIVTGRRPAVYVTGFGAEPAGGFLLIQHSPRSNDCTRLMDGGLMPDYCWNPRAQRPRPRPRLTPEERRRRNCEMNARASSTYPQNLGVAGGSALRNIVGSLFRRVIAPAILYYDGIVWVDARINNC